MVWDEGLLSLELSTLGTLDALGIMWLHSVQCCSEKGEDFFDSKITFVTFGKKKKQCLSPMLGLVFVNIKIPTLSSLQYKYIKIVLI